MTKKLSPSEWLRRRKARYGEDYTFPRGPKCPHGKRRHLCLPCGGKGICEHGIQRNYCPRCDSRGVYRSYRNSARKRGIDFALTFEQFHNLINSPCSYCGESFSGGVDRQDSAKGYTPENSVPSCAVDNYAKQSLTRQEYLNHIEKVHTFQQEKMR